MRWTGVILFLMACAPSVSAEPPSPEARPKIRAPSNIRVVATCPATGSCKLLASWTLPSSWRATDTLKLVWSQTAPGTVSNLRSVPSRGTSDTLTLPRTIEGQPYAGKFCATTVRPGSSSQPSACGTWTAPAIPVAAPDTVTGIQVVPASFTVEATKPGVTPTAVNRQQLCAFVAFRTGHIGFRRPMEGAIAFCDSAYRALPATLRVVTVSEQTAADGVCITWSASSGTITPEVCPSGPAVRFSPVLKLAVSKVRIVPAPIVTAERGI